MTQPVPVRSPVPGIIAMELQAALRDTVPGAGVPWWASGIREWPGKVVPVNDAQVKAAVLTLISRTRWPSDQARPLATALAPLYEAGWCNDAVVRMLDYDPDGTRQPPWFIGDGSPTAGPLLAYLNRRLTRWRDTVPDGADVGVARLPDPPVLGTSFQAWAERMRLVYGNRPRGQDPRPAAAGAAGPRRPGPAAPTPLDRRRAVVTRRQAALQALGSSERLEDDPDITPDTALLLDPGVHEAIAVLVRTGDRRHVPQVRRAVLLARLAVSASEGPDTSPGRHADIRRLASLITGPDGTPVPLAMVALLLAEFG